MFRYRVQPPVPPLDEATAERLLAGAPLDDVPDAYRPLADLVAAASGPPLPHELEGSTAAAAEFVAAHAAAHPPRKQRRVGVAAAVATFVLVASTGTAVAATRGALPRPVQAVAHDALGAVGISVPGTDDGSAGRNAPTGGDGSISTPAAPDTGTPTITAGGADGVNGAAGGSPLPADGATTGATAGSGGGASAPAPDVPAATPPDGGQPSGPADDDPGRAEPPGESPGDSRDGSDGQVPPGQQKKAAGGEERTPPGQGGVPPGQAKKDG